MNFLFSRGMITILYCWHEFLSPKGCFYFSKWVKRSSSTMVTPKVARNQTDDIIRQKFHIAIILPKLFFVSIGLFSNSYPQTKGSYLNQMKDEIINLKTYLILWINIFLLLFVIPTTTVNKSKKAILNHEFERRSVVRMLIYM